MSAIWYREGLRPQFHFTARQGWLNDPNGLVYYDGEYHLFFQHNPFGTEWGNMTWGHAVSRDLVHWTQLDNALTPDRLGSMFSGSVVVDHENTAGFQAGREKALVAIYTAAGDTTPDSKGQPYTQCLAFSTDRGRTWTKYDGNPVLPHVVGCNRDPKVVWYEPHRVWIMTLYLDRNTYGFFSSRDLKRWDFLHDMDVPGCAECPDFFEMSLEDAPDQRRWVWTAANGHYLVGTFDGRRFRPELGPVVSDWGANFYAVQTFSDIPASDGRRIQMAWMAGGSYPGMPFNQQMSFPCELRLRRTARGLRILRQPVRELARLRGRCVAWSGREIGPGAERLDGAEGDLLEVRADLEGAGARAFGLRLHGATVRYTPLAGELWCLNRSAPLAAADGHLRIQALVDRTSLEVFAEQGVVSLSACCNPQPDQAIEVFAVGGGVRVHELQIYVLRSAWNPPATART